MARSRTANALLAVGLALVVVLAVGGWIVWQASNPAPGSVTHEYEYRVSVDPSATLSNVTLYLPLPVENGTSVVGARLENATGPVQTHVAETPRGPMLAVTAAELPTKYRTQSVPRPQPTGTATTTTDARRGSPPSASRGRPTR